MYTYTFKRIATYFIDIAVMLLVVSVALRIDINQLMMVFVLGTATLHPPSIESMVLTLVIPILLYGFMTGYLGWTPGKLAMKLRIKGIDAKPIGVGKGILREAIKWTACTFLIFGLVWALYGIFTGNRTFYDDWLHTSVEDESPQDGLKLTEVQRRWRDFHEHG